MRQLELNREKYYPQYSAWIIVDLDDADDYKNINWAEQIMFLKVAARLPLYSVSKYTEEELLTLAVADYKYGTLRSQGLNHYESLKETTYALAQQNTTRQDIGTQSQDVWAV